MSDVPLTLQIAGAAGGLATITGALVTLAITGRRSERQRRRDLHARALAAITTYGEMPYRIRRRAPGAEARFALSEDLSRVKVEVDVCQVLLAADGDARLSGAYDELYLLARRTAGLAAHEAWKDPPVDKDPEMNMGGVFRELAPFNEGRQAFADDLRRATLPPIARARRRARRWIRFLPSEPKRRTIQGGAPQDTAGATDEDDPPEGASSAASWP
ncbi:hypothetical protein AB0L40_09410 [Patulibacter sp. NPDC049589]|uniref:hypothetical protein n=1 Tax=Patulibacter sp. NPDC049589 TaxID=3154731 RepID=UPI003428E87D